MELTLFTRILAIAALTFAAIAFARQLRAYTRLTRPGERAATKGSARAGVLYAYTLGMAPWAKESTRLHLVAYLRGVAFHLGIFLGLGILLSSPWLDLLPAIGRLFLAWGAGLGALLGLAGFAARLVERNLKALSTPDDYTAVLLVSLFLASASLWLFVPAALPLFYLASAAMLIYAPFGKIRHCLYYAYSRLFFGKFVGSRAVLPHSQQGAR
jgi:hypothetical protein